MIVSAAGMDESAEPTNIDVVKDDSVTVTFADGEVARFGIVELRENCPCATCRHHRERGEVSWPRPGSPTPLRLESAGLHGAWGLTFTWNDGHDTGIFPFESLRRWHDERQDE